MNEEKEVMETIENEDLRPVESEDNTYEEVEGGSGKVIGLAIAGVATVAAVGVGLYKKLKANKSDKPKRKRLKLVWVDPNEEVDEETIVADVEAEEVDDTETTTEE